MMETIQYGLKENTIQKIRSIFATHPEVEEVILYGSRATGNFSNGSDIDLVLKGKGLNQALLNKIRWELDDLLLPYTIDIAIYDKIDNPDLIEHIHRVGIVFYRK
jgi:predicted nucleotidyltransferase